MPARPLILAAAILLATILGALPTGTVPTTNAAGPGTWSPAADMPLPRKEHESTLLPNGKVLITGGGDAAPPYSWETAIYTRSTNSWTPGANMLYARVWHEATLLRDGRVLVTGGWNQADDATLTEIYSPASNTWTAAAPMNYPRMRHTATLLPDGRVLVTGGTAEPNSSSEPSLVTAEIYDTVANSWTDIPDMQTQMFDHAALLLPNGRVLVVGASATAEIYDPISNTWTPAPSPASFDYGLKGVLLPDGRALLVDKSTARVYDPIGDAWTMADPPPILSQGFTLTLLGNGKAMRVGSSHPGYPTASHFFNPVSLTWDLAGSVITPRLFGAASLLPTGELLITGGEKNTVGIAASSELYDPTAWLAVSSPVTPPRSGHTATLLWNGKVLVAGGGSSSAQTFDETTQSWSSAGTLSASRVYHSAARLNDGRVLVVGGTDGPGGPSLLTAEIYSQNTNSWTPVAPPATAHVGDSAVVIADGRVVVYGGGSGTTPEIYNPATNTWSFGAENVSAGIPGPAYRTSSGKVLTLDFGGTFLYDPMTDTWSGPLGYPGPFLPGVGDQLEGTSKIVLAGGNSACPPAQTPTTNAVVVFDGALQTWSTATQLATARNGHTATALYNGKLLVAGGYRSTATCQTSPTATEGSAELYDPAANAWTSAGALTTARQAHTATRMTSGNVLIVGGTNSFGVVGLTEYYDLGIHTDTDGDGYNDGLELALGQHPWSNCKTMRADVSGDGTVNVADIGRIAAQVGRRPPPSRIDQNNDKVINVADLGLAASQSGKSVLSCA